MVLCVLSNNPLTETGYTMDAIITVNYRVHLEEEDAEDTENTEE